MPQDKHEPELRRFPNPVAVSAFLRKAGPIKDRRTRRLRDRGAKKRWAIKDAE